jgi:hypothetical protein
MDIKKPLLPNRRLEAEAACIIASENNNRQTGLK